MTTPPKNRGRGTGRVDAVFVPLDDRDQTPAVTAENDRKATATPTLRGEVFAIADDALTRR
jgi:hypothetical protein